MKYSRNGIYNYVYNKVIASYPSAYISSKFEPVPPQYPSVFVRGIGKYADERCMTFGGSQGVNHYTFEVQVQSNKSSGAAQEAWSVLNKVHEAFKELAFRVSNENILEDGDAGVYRIVATYRRVIGDADEMPTVTT